MTKEKEPPRRWHPLDNTANLFPVITTRKFTNVYRLSLCVKAAVEPELLQQALESVLPRFAAFRVRLRRGVFWRYLEANPELPLVYQEDEAPCTYIDPKQNKNFLFRVTYFENRINLEVFHVLTDGTGGMQFLQALCCRYLLLAYPSHFTPEEHGRFWFAQHAANTEDSYLANYVPGKKSGFRIGRGYRLRGGRDILDTLSVVHAYIPVKPLLALCRQKGVTVTQYLTACIGWAIYTQQLKERPPKHPVNIFMPVNLRNLFSSTTALNFFSNIYISLAFQPAGLSFDDLLQQVKQQFEEKLTPESMREKISYTAGASSNPFMRLVPLPLKSVALRAIFEASAGSSTMGFSNLGRVEMPKIFEPYVTGASFLLSCAPREPFKCTACSYNDVLTFSCTSLLHSQALQRSIVRQLSAAGLELTIETNGVDYDKL